ncbi:MAG: alpha/beta hydrolase [Thiohalomonadales bacterium]
MSTEKSSEVFINGPDGQLQLIHTTLKNSFDINSVAIICHPHPLYGGSMSNKVVHIINKAFNNAGLNTVRFNFRGVEKSQGQFANGVGEVDDLIAVFDYLVQQTEINSIYLAGFSFGSFIAAQLASREQTPIKIKKLLLVAPPFNMYDFANVKIKIPCLVIQGGKDTVVDPEQVKQWVAKQGNNVELEWNDEAEHFFHGKLNFIRDAVTNHWF